MKEFQRNKIQRDRLLKVNQKKSLTRNWRKQLRLNVYHSRTDVSQLDKKEIDFSSLITKIKAQKVLEFATSIYRAIKAIHALYSTCMFSRMTWLFHNIKYIYIHNSQYISQYGRCCQFTLITSTLS